MKRTVFYISDGTGITAKALGRSLLTQFENQEFTEISIPYVKDVAATKQAVDQIKQAFIQDGYKPLLFATLVNPTIHTMLSKSDGLLLDFFQTFIEPLEIELGRKSSHTIGRTHGLQNYENYMTRINAVHYALNNDDGSNIRNYEQADFIIVGVSRCGKTPTCLYIALQFGLNAANYPFTEEDMNELTIPNFLQPFRNKLFGLTIDANRLHKIREERRPNSPYSSLKQCKYEIDCVEVLFRKEKIPFLNTTTRSIEEISTEILSITGVGRKF